MKARNSMAILKNPEQHRLDIAKNIIAKAIDNEVLMGIDKTRCMICDKIPYYLQCADKIIKELQQSQK